MNTTQTRVRTQTAEDLWRLCHQAEAKGVRILCEPSTMQHFSTSATDPTVLYRVSEAGCTCRGFSVWRRCMHHSLFLATLGGIPDVEPTVNVTDVVIVEAAAPCRSCKGTGFLRMTTGPALSDWVVAPCTNCTGHQATPATLTHPVAAHVA